MYTRPGVKEHLFTDPTFSFRTIQIYCWLLKVFQFWFERISDLTKLNKNKYFYSFSLICATIGNVVAILQRILSFWVCSGHINNPRRIVKSHSLGTVVVSLFWTWYCKVLNSKKVLETSHKNSSVSPDSMRSTFSYLQSVGALNCLSLFGLPSLADVRVYYHFMPPYHFNICIERCLGCDVNSNFSRLSRSTKPSDIVLAKLRYVCLSDTDTCSTISLVSFWTFCVSAEP